MYQFQQSASMFGWDLINDLGALPENEEIIIDFLLKRLQRGQIYTWVGSLLLTINPNDEISTSHLYNLSEFDKYINSSDAVYGAEPHIFTIAAKAHYSLTRELGRNCQVIVISGATATGKTFNVCKCLEFLSKINENVLLPCQGDYTHNIMIRIMDACRLISAFTTACTESNEVSSRHGQLVCLHYKAGTISGATINSFLLERSRVTKGSNNFQIFYQMIFGMSCTELEYFRLSKDERYDILDLIDPNKEKYFEESFQDTSKALDVLGFKTDQKRNIFQVLALLLHLGNIKFVDRGETCTIDFNDRRSMEALKSTCTLSSLTEDVMIELLTTILINPQSVWRKHTTYHRHLITVDACRNRLHSIIRHVYDLLFHWILNRTNNFLHVKHEVSRWLGILDIFGFESFNKNDIEQLCVNYANERMQQYFIETHLERGRRELEEEGFIRESNSLHTVNLYKERLNVIEGLFLTLNDACQSLVTVNVQKLIQLACSNLHNEQSKVLKAKEGYFVIEHYSGPVAYSIDDLLSKNTDKVPSEISVVFNASSNKFLRSLINIEEECLNTVKTSTRKRTMLAKLKYNIDVLIKELRKCDSHYVRCVKLNRLGNNEWDRTDFRKQLACIGIFDILPLAKCKYPVRLSYRNFCQRYSKRSTNVADLNKCNTLLESVVSKRELRTLVHFGKQMIFLTEPVFFKLEFCRRNYRIKCANKIQIFWIKHRRKTIPAISKYLTTSYQTRDEANMKITPVKILLDRELKKSNNSEEYDDDVFLAGSVSPKNGLIDQLDSAIRDEQEINAINPIETLDEVPTEINNESEKRSSIMEELGEDIINIDPKCKFEDNHVESYVEDIIKCIQDINPEEFLRSKYCEDLGNRNLDTDIKFNDDNNNYPLKQCIERSMDKEFIEEKAEQRYPMHYKTIRIFKMGPFMFFYRNRILSRRRLAEVPVKVHTRPTCLINSHKLPHYMLPQGLQDCLY